MPLKTEIQDKHIDELRAALRMCNSFTRLPTLLAWAYCCDARDWLTVLGEEWSSCDNITENIEGLLDTPLGDLMEAPLDGRKHLMTAAELDTLNKLPDTVTVYRGCYVNNRCGLSWSLDPEVAASFPNLHRYRQEGQSILLMASVLRDEILAVKLDRQEAEIVCSPRMCYDLPFGP